MKVLICLMLLVASVAPAFGQQPATLEGRLVNSLNAEALAGVAVVIDELKREAVSGPDGTFRFENVSPARITCGCAHRAIHRAARKSPCDRERSSD